MEAVGRKKKAKLSAVDEANILIANYLKYGRASLRHLILEGVKVCFKVF